MVEQEIQTIINTLMQSGLASSEGEAHRMATDMIGTTQKVQNEYSARKDQNHMFADQVKRKPVDEPVKKTTEDVPTAKQPPIKEVEQNLGMQNRINELRNAALNPKPVEIQVNFQTPKSDREKNSNSQIQQEKPVENYIETETSSISPLNNTNFQDINSSTNRDSPEKDFEIPGVDNNLTIGELSNQGSEAPKNDFFAQEQESSNIKTNDNHSSRNDFQENIKPNSIQDQIQKASSQFGGIESGFPSETQTTSEKTTDTQLANGQNTESQTPVGSDFLEVKDEQQQNNDSVYEDNQQMENQPQTQYQQTNNNNNIQTSKAQTNNDTQSQEQQNTNSPKPKQESRWTEEERKLKEEVDLTKVFNFGNK